MTTRLDVPILVAESDTGVSRELLRMWERRYGFPAPRRNARGIRQYPPEQIDKLRLLRQLIDRGRRPGQIIALDCEQLAQILAQGD